MGKMKNLFMDLRELESDEDEYLDEEYVMGVEMPNQRDLDNLFNLDDDD